MKLNVGEARYGRGENQHEKPVGLDWESVIDWPTDARQLQELREALDLDIEQQFRNGLSEHLRSYYGAAREQNPELDRELDEQFDKFLVSQAPVLGARLLLSNFVQFRVLKWSLGATDGCYFQEKFFEGLVRYSRLRFDEADVRGDIREDLHQAKRDTKCELNALRKEIGVTIANRNRPLELAYIKKIIDRNAEAYPLLHVNLTGLLEFCRKHEAFWNCFAEGTMSAAQFFDEWIGWSTNRDPESVRQKISGRK